MAKNDRLEPARIKKVLEKSKYKVTGKIGVKVARLKASGSQKLPEDVVASNQLNLEFENIEGEWRPVPPVGEDFTSATSMLHSVAKGVTTKAYIRNRTDLERVLIKIGALQAPEGWPEPTKKRGGFMRRGGVKRDETTAGAAGAAAEGGTKRAGTAGKETTTQAAVKPVKSQPGKKAAAVSKRGAKPAKSQPGKKAAAANKPASVRAQKPAGTKSGKTTTRPKAGKSAAAARPKRGGPRK